MADLDAASPFAHPFQTEPFVALFNTDSSRATFALVATDDRGLAAHWRGYFVRYADGLIPRSKAWMRSGPVVREDLGDRRGNILAAMLPALKRHLARQGVGRAIFTSETLYGADCDGACISHGLRRHDLQTYLVDLTPSEEEMSQKIDQRSRWSVNKARKNGMTIDEVIDDEDIAAYYRLYMETASVPGSGPPSERQFVTGFRRLRDEGGARIIVARHGDEMVAGSLFICHAGLVAQLQTALTGEGRRLNAGALLLWESMLSFKENGSEAMDLISVEVAPAKGSREAGVRDFKSKWGGALLDTPVYQYLSPNVRLLQGFAARLRDWRVRASRLSGAV